MLYAGLMPNIFYLELYDESQISKTSSGRKTDQSILKQWFPSIIETFLGIPDYQRGTQNLQNKINLGQFYLKTYINRPSNT